MRPDDLAVCSRECVFVADDIKLRAKNKLLMNLFINHCWNRLGAEDNQALYQRQSVEILINLESVRNCTETALLCPILNIDNVF